ncbi:uncharacterized protein LOC142234334 [Haematobia irritans]|uniref:uncharacterized protein LOC142234334 n=1 Tax=Haematobia irritans TaxID=7368 RepID=UPI003F4F905F
MQSAKTNDAEFDFRTQIPTVTNSQGYTSANTDSNDLYVNFLCIFACIYVLAKITDMAEKYLAHEIYDKLNTTRRKSQENAAKISGKNLYLEINKLEMENSELKFKLYSISNEVYPSAQNIFITRRNFNWNQNIYLKGDCEKDNINNDNSVWLKYLQLQKNTCNKKVNLGYKNNFEKTFSPTIMSAQDLENVNWWSNKHNE